MSREIDQIHAMFFNRNGPKAAVRLVAPHEAANDPKRRLVQIRKIGRLPGLIYRESSSARPFVASEIVAAWR